MARPRKDAGGKPAKDKIIEAAFRLIRSKGYSAATVDEFCAAAGVTKGTFFHYFTSKEDLAVQAAHHWSQVTGEFFQKAPFRAKADPLERFLAYIQLRREMIRGDIVDYTCLAGTLVQETYDSHPEIRNACQKSIFDHAATLEDDIAEAIRLYPPATPFEAKSLALHTQAVIQGAFILAKASSNVDAALACLDHLISYVNLLFERNKA